MDFGQLQLSRDQRGKRAGRPGFRILLLSEADSPAQREPHLLDGAFTLLAEQDQQIFAYTRTDETEELLVCANFTKDPADAV
ncbi:MAG: alpha-glucosidase C-terminal domain-containing protein [Gallintestinimicrobium sp.]